jgi:hypothetical protein
MGGFQDDFFNLSAYPMLILSRRARVASEAVKDQYSTPPLTVIYLCALYMIPMVMISPHVVATSPF